jgi:hypothetical protein
MYMQDAIAIRGQPLGLSKKLGLKVPTNASTDELMRVHDHLLIAPSPKHYNLSKLVKNVDLVHPLL